jgi:uncharacterized membrane protein YraQ (UPF0718 family)
MTLFLSYFFISVPFLLLGVIISSYLLVFVDEQRLAARFPRNRVLGAIAGSFLGLLFPVAQYGNIPVTRRLLTHGVPLAVGMSFLVAAGSINPLTIWLGLQLFPEYSTLIVARLLFSWLIALAIGILFSFYPLKSRSLAHLQPYAPEERSLLLVSGSRLATDTQPRHRAGNLIYGFPLPAAASRSWGVFLENLGRESLEYLIWLIAACAIASAILAFLPQAQLLATDNPRLQIPLLLVLGFLIPLASPFSFAFLLPLLHQLFPASLLAFLLFGSILDMSQFILMIPSFRPQIIFSLLLLTLLFSLFFALILNSLIV